MNQKKKTPKRRKIKLHRKRLRNSKFGQRDRPSTQRAGKPWIFEWAVARKRKPKESVGARL